MPSAGMRALVPPIATVPLPNGLLGGCIDVITTTDMHELNGTELISTACIPAQPWQDCPDPTGTWTNPGSKVFARPDVCAFDPVTAYAGIECSAIGMTYDDFARRALDQLAMGEQDVVERWLMTQQLTAAVSGTVDLTPAGGAVHVVRGVGDLEGWLAANYGGQGVLHAPVGAASLLSMYSVVPDLGEEACPTTAAGNKVVVGGGYAANTGPDGTVAAAGEAWLYITPAIRIRRDQPHVVSSPALSLDTRVNDRLVLAESTFVVELACCMAAAVRVTLNP